MKWVNRKVRGGYTYRAKYLGENFEVRFYAFEKTYRVVMERPVKWEIERETTAGARQNKAEAVQTFYETFKGLLDISALDVLADIDNLNRAVRRTKLRDAALLRPRENKSDGAGILKVDELAAETPGVYLYRFARKFRDKMMSSSKLSGGGLDERIFRLIASHVCETGFIELRWCRDVDTEYHRWHVVNLVDHIIVSGWQAAWALWGFMKTNPPPDPKIYSTVWDLLECYAGEMERRMVSCAENQLLMEERGKAPKMLASGSE